ncbi:hypothetical protein [Roseateles sp.]|uniref:hypothetical protein n=1 Tax=Roseateles sp. TaxID=1971397 RepID=UPI0031D7FDA2
MEKPDSNPSSIVKRILDALPAEELSARETALAKLPNLYVGGDIENLGVTLSGPITFSVQQAPRRKP